MRVQANRGRPPLQGGPAARRRGCPALSRGPLRWPQAPRLVIENADTGVHHLADGGRGAAEDPPDHVRGDAKRPPGLPPGDQRDQCFQAPPSPGRVHPRHGSGDGVAATVRVRSGSLRVVRAGGHNNVRRRLSCRQEAAVPDVTIPLTGCTNMSGCLGRPAAASHRDRPGAGCGGRSLHKTPATNESAR
jgi:hypothetical protein